MGIMDMFKTVQPAAPVTPAQPGNIPEAAAAATALPTPGTAASGALPSGAADPAKSPLDAFEKLWETVKPEGDGNNGYFNVNMEALNKAAAGQDFTAALTPEKMAAIAAGGEPAIKAMMEAMNTVAQATYANSALVTTKIVERALNDAESRYAATLPSLMKKHNLSDSLRTENPAFSHPAAQPVIKALEAQLTVKYPDATAAELRDQALQYLTALGALFNPAAEIANDPRTGKAPREEMDWSKFLQ